MRVVLGAPGEHRLEEGELRGGGDRVRDRDEKLELLLGVLEFAGHDLTVDHPVERTRVRFIQPPRLAVPVSISLFCVSYSSSLSHFFSSLFFFFLWTKNRRREAARLHRPRVLSQHHLLMPVFVSLFLHDTPRFETLRHARRTSFWARSQRLSRTGGEDTSETRIFLSTSKVTRVPEEFDTGRDFPHKSPIFQDPNTTKFQDPSRHRF